MALSEQQERFCEEFLVDYNATHAAIRAGYSPKTAEQSAARLMRRQDVKDFLDVRRAKIARRLGVSQERIVKELAKIAFGDMSDVVDFQTGKVKEFVDREDLAIIAGVKVKIAKGKVNSQEYEVKGADKLRALELLMKNQGMLDKKVEVGFKNNLEVSVTDAMNAAKARAKELEDAGRGGAAADG